MKKIVATVFSQGNSQDGVKEITDLLEREGYEIAWQVYPNNAVIIKETEEQ